MIKPQMKPTLKFNCAIWCHFALIPLGKAMNTIYSPFSPTANHSRDRKKSKYMDKSLWLLETIVLSGLTEKTWKTLIGRKYTIMKILLKIVLYIP